MKIKWIVVIPVLIAIIAFAGVQAKQSSKQTGISTSNKSDIKENFVSSSDLPLFSIQAVDGKVVSLQSFKGKKVFVNLWASWCPPCKREMPTIEKLYKSLDTAKVAFVLLSLDDQFDKARKFMQARNFSAPIYHPAESLPDIFNVEGIPATFIFDENGNLIQRVEGGDDYNTNFYKTLLK